MNRTRALCLAAVLVGVTAVPGRAEEMPEGPRILAFRQSERDFGLGLASQRRGDRESAIRHYESAVAADPGFVEALVNLARAVMDEGDPARAHGLLDAAEALRPEYPAVHSVRGLLALRQGELQSALDSLDEARRLAPGEVEVLVNSGAVLLVQGLYEEARRLLERAVRTEPDNTEAVLNLALVEDHAGRSAHAAFGYRRFLALAASADPAREAVSDRLRVLTHESHGLPAVALGRRDNEKEKSK